MKKIMKDKIKEILDLQKVLNNKIETLTKVNEKPKMDFSKWVCRYWETLAIKGSKLLKTFEDDDIQYSNDGRDYLYDDEVGYEVVELKDLKQGDLFINDNIESPYLYNFNIFIEQGEKGGYACQYLNTSFGVEAIKSVIYPVGQGNIKVKRFLRY